MTQLDVRKATEDYALAFYGPVLIQLWQTCTPDDGARLARLLAQELSRSNHPKVGTIVIVPENSAMPSAAARDELSQLPPDMGRGVGLAMVREGSGFRASTVRAILTGMMLFSRNSVPHQIFSDTPSAAHWLTERLDVPGGTAGLVRVISELQSKFQGARAA